MFLQRSHDVIKLEELDLWYALRKSAASYNGMLAVEMLNIAMIHFSYGAIEWAVVHLIFATIIAVSCIRCVIWAKRAKRLVKHVEEGLKKKEDQNNAEDT